MFDRNAAIRLIKLPGKEGVEEWKREEGYGKRLYIKGFFSRLIWVQLKKQIRDKS